MKTILIKDYISSAFSQQNALKIRRLVETLLKTEDKIILDFSDISKFTTLFFNFSTGYFISLLGPNIYNKKISLENLSDLGKSTYESSYDNAVLKYEPNEDINDEIINIIKNPEN